MSIVTLDFETFYGKDYTLSSMTTEEYVRDPRFEVIGVSVKVDDAPAVWFSGTKAETKRFLDGYDLPAHICIAHNALFDMSILSWRFDIRPKRIVDTLSMARALHGAEVGVGLAKLVKHYGLGEKGTEVVQAFGKRRADFTPEELSRYGDYCCNDTELTRKLFDIMGKGFPLNEFKLIDMTVRMFTEPVLELDKTKLDAHAINVAERKAKLLDSIPEDLSTIMSSEKLAEALRARGVEPPVKLSPRTDKETYAFAKSDEEFLDLLDHPDLEVQALVAARLGLKSTLEETRTARLRSIADRGKLPVPLRYYAAHTGRWGGEDKINLQNIPRVSPLKYALRAPPGWRLVDCDSSQIEARILAWLAEQDDLTDAFTRGEDVYRIMASSIYGKRPADIDKGERFVGKTTILGCGYGMGGVRFKKQLKNSTPSVDIHEDEAKRIVYTYRDTYSAIPDLWKQGQAALMAMVGDRTAPLGRDGILSVEGKDGIRLPNGLYQRYPNLRWEEDEKTGELNFMYDTYKGKTAVRTKIYGGKLVENCIAYGTLVLTDVGWKPIQYVADTDLVHDGIEFVAHGGKVFKSVQSCTQVDGVYMTPDHEVLTDEGWKAASQRPRPYRPDLRGADGDQSGEEQRGEIRLEVPLRLRGSMCEAGGISDERGEARRNTQLRLHDPLTDIQGQHHPWHEQASRIRGVAQYVGQVSPTYASSMEELRGAWHLGVRQMANWIYRVLGGYGTYVPAWSGLGTAGQYGPLLTRKLRVGEPQGQLHEPKEHRTSRGCGGFEQGYRDSTHHNILQAGARLAGGGAGSETLSSKPVYDILNAGPRQRFVVLGNDGPFIVHNCCQALARIVIGEQMIEVSKRYRPTMTVHDAIGAAARVEDIEECRAYVVKCMKTRPAWAPDLPLNCESAFGLSYGDCSDKS